MPTRPLPDENATDMPCAPTGALLRAASRAAFALTASLSNMGCSSLPGEATPAVGDRIRSAVAPFGTETDSPVNATRRCSRSDSLRPCIIGDDPSRWLRSENTSWVMSSLVKLSGLVSKTKLFPSVAPKRWAKGWAGVANRRVICDKEQRSAALNPVVHGITFRPGECRAGIVVVVRQVPKRVRNHQDIDVFEAVSREAVSVGDHLITVIRRQLCERFKESVLCMNVAVGL